MWITQCDWCSLRVETNKGINTALPAGCLIQLWQSTCNTQANHHGHYHHDVAVGHKLPIFFRHQMHNYQQSTHYNNNNYCWLTGQWQPHKSTIHGQLLLNQSTNNPEWFHLATAHTSAPWCKPTPSCIYPTYLVTLCLLHDHSPSYMTNSPPPSLPRWYILEQAWFIHSKGILAHITHECTTNSAYLYLPPFLYGYSTATTSPTAHCSMPPSGLNFPNCEMTLYNMGSAMFTCMGCPHRPRPPPGLSPIMLASFLFFFFLLFPCAHVPLAHHGLITLFTTGYRCGHSLCLTMPTY